MNKQQQQEFFDDFTRKMAATLLSKGDDYSVDSDRLSNFKNVGKITETGEDGRTACLTLIATKVARLSNLINTDKQAKNESIDDSILDLANYAVLLAMLQKEVSETKEQYSNIKKYYTTYIKK